MQKIEPRGRIRLQNKDKSAEPEKSEKFHFLGISARDVSTFFLVLQVPMRTEFSEALRTGQPSE